MNIRTQGRECLTAAFQLLLLSGKYKYVKMLIEAGVDVNVTVRKDIQSNLIYTAQRGDIECAKLLLNAGAAVNIRQTDGHTALEFCLERHHCIPGKKDEEAFIPLLFAAGEKVPGTRFTFTSPHLLCWPLNCLLMDSFNCKSLNCVCLQNIPTVATLTCLTLHKI